MALIPVDSVQRLAAECTTSIEYGLSQDLVERTRVAIEVLSRLVLRLDADAALEILDKALKYYTNRQDRIASHPWLADPIGNLLRRSWDTLPPDRRSSRVLNMLDAPIVGLDGFHAQIEDYHPDPGNVLLRDSALLLPERVSDNEDHWQAVVRLLIRGLGAGGAARRRSATRLVPLLFQSRLTEAETSQIGKALWAEKHTPGDSLPQDTDLYDWVFLTLPEPNPGLAEARFRLKWLSADFGKLEHSAPSPGGTTTVSLSSEPRDPAKLEDTLWNVGAAITRENRGRPFELSSDERKRIVELLSLWAKADVPSYTLTIFPDAARQPTLRALEGLASILAEVEIPESVGEDLYTKLKRLTESDTPAFGPIGELVQIIPSRMSEIVSWLRSGLASNSRDIVTSALSCLASWLQRSKGADSSFKHPPSDLFREVGLVIAGRRKGALSSALEVAKLVFDEGTDEQREAISEYVLHGLGYLAEELRYEGEHGDDCDVPFLRWRCTQLASSMLKAGLGDQGVVIQWLELATSDPLPEVRYAVTPSMHNVVRDQG